MLRRSDWPQPIGVDDRLAPGEAVYSQLAEFPAHRAGDPPVALYENLLWQAPTQRSLPAGTNAEIERLKWPAAGSSENEPPPAVGIPAVGGPTWRDGAIAAAGAAAYICLFIVRFLKKSTNAGKPASV